MTRRDEHLWEEEVVEIFIDPAGRARTTPRSRSTRRTWSCDLLVRRAVAGAATRSRLAFRGPATRVRHDARARARRRSPGRPGGPHRGAALGRVRSLSAESAARVPPSSRRSLAVQRVPDQAAGRPRRPGARSHLRRLVGAGGARASTTPCSGSVSLARVQRMVSCLAMAGTPVTRAVSTTWPSTARMIEGATIALLPGDPGRVPHIAQTAPFTDARELASKREYRTWLGCVRGHAGAGDVDRHRRALGVDRDRRARAAGRHAPSSASARRARSSPTSRVGSVIVTTGAVRLDGASTTVRPGRVSRRRPPHARRRP